MEVAGRYIYIIYYMIYGKSWQWYSRSPIYNILLSAEIDKVLLYTYVLPIYIILHTYIFIRRRVSAYRVGTRRECVVIKMCMKIGLENKIMKKSVFPIVRIAVGKLINRFHGKIMYI